MDLSVAERAKPQPVDPDTTYRPMDMVTALPLDSDADDPIVHRILARESDRGHVPVAAFGSAV